MPTRKCGDHYAILLVVLHNSGYWTKTGKVSCCVVPVGERARCSPEGGIQSLPIPMPIPIGAFGLIIIIIATGTGTGTGTGAGTGIGTGIGTGTGSATKPDSARAINSATINAPNKDIFENVIVSVMAV
jgi:hypothetical protein